MIVLALILILTGSFAGATVLWMQGGSLWQIALGYVAGGWTGLIVGMSVVLLWKAVAAGFGKFQGKKVPLCLAASKHRESSR